MNLFTPSFLGRPPTVPGTTAFALNAAGTWVGCSIMGNGKTLNVVRQYVSALAGTVIAADATLSLCSDSANTPGSVLEAKNCGSAITAAGWYEWTGFTTALTFGTRYWLVWKNLNASPASNFPTIQHLTDFLLFSTTTPNRKTSTNSGSSWSATSGGIAGFRMAFSDGTYDGTPLSSFGTAGVGTGIYSTRECGGKFTSPNGYANVMGVAVSIAAVTGSPIGTLQLKLYTGQTPVLVDTAPCQSLVGAGAGTVWAPFPSVHTISPRTICRVVAGETTQSDASTNRYNTNVYAVDNNAASKALMPYGGMSQTYFDGSTWADDDTLGVQVMLLLESGNELITRRAYGSRR